MKNKALFFKNLFVSGEGKGGGNWYSQATFYFASAFRKNKLPFLLCDSKFSFNPSKIFNDMSALDDILKEHPEINLVCVTLLEGCFFQTKKLIEHIRRRSNAFIAVGGIMATMSPEHLRAHLPGANLIIRGEAEEILPEIFKILRGFSRKTVLSRSVIHKIEQLRGVIFQNGGHLARSLDMSPNFIANLDNAALDFSLLEKNDIAQGLNLSASRGCRNACFFCSMPRAGGFRAKSFKNLKEILAAYKKRLIEIYGSEHSIPAKALELSFNDDDFLGDRDRAIKFFNFIKRTDFKISFLQTAINSLFIYEGGRSTDKLDEELLDAMGQDIFSRPDISGQSRYSVYIGTENFCDRELRRLGKGYGFKKAEKAIRALSRRKIRQAHHLILTNRETSLDDLTENFVKIGILKEKYGDYFDILRPVIPNLVSFFHSASYKIAKERGQLGFLRPRALLSSKRYPDLDYPLIEKDLPQDADVREIADKAGKFLSGDRYRYDFLTQALTSLAETAKGLKKTQPERIKKIECVLKKYQRFSSNAVNNGTRVVARLSDLGNFLASREKHLPPLGTDDAVVLHLYARARDILEKDGPLLFKKMAALDNFLLSLVYAREEMLLRGADKSRVARYAELIDAFYDYPWQLAKNSGVSLADLSQGVNRLVVMMTHSCQLRCRYCNVIKFRSDMSEESLKKTIDLLFTSKKPEVQLQFFGGEPLLRFSLLKKTVAYAKSKSARSGKKIRFIITTNGIALDKNKADFLVRNNFTIECSFDGTMETQLRARRAADGRNYYDTVVRNLGYLVKKNADFYIISVVQPENVVRLYRNLKYFYDLGFKRLQINYVLGRYWSKEKAGILLAELARIKKIFKGRDGELINATGSRIEPVALNVELTVDSNGDIFPEFDQLQKPFYLGNLDTIKDINIIFNTKSRNFKKMADVHSGNTKRRREFFNSIKLGFAADKLLRE